MSELPILIPCPIWGSLQYTKGQCSKDELIDSIFLLNMTNVPVAPAHRPPCARVPTVLKGKSLVPSPADLVTCVPQRQ